MLQKVELFLDSDLQQVWPRVVGLAELLAAEEDREGAEDVTLWQGLLRPRLARLLPAVRLIHVVPTRRARRCQWMKAQTNKICLVQSMSENCSPRTARKRIHGGGPLMSAVHESMNTCETYSLGNLSCKCNVQFHRTLPIELLFCFCMTLVLKFLPFSCTQAAAARLATGSTSSTADPLPQEETGGKSEEEDVNAEEAPQFVQLDWGEEPAQMDLEGPGAVAATAAGNTSSSPEPPLQ